MFDHYEIIVVNDGSTDDTCEKVFSIEGGVKDIHLLGYEKNMGKGYAVRLGISQSKGDLLLLTDADLSTPIEEIEKLLTFYDDGCDVIMGSRALRGSDIVTRQPWWRVLMGKTFNILVRFSVIGKFRDTQCGFKLFRGEPGRRVFRYATVNRFAFDVEIIYLAVIAGYKVCEVPIRWRNSPASKVAPLKDSLRMAVDLFKLRMRREKLKKDISSSPRTGAH